MSELRIEELVVGRHVKVASKFGRLEIHATNSTLGVWVSGSKRDEPIGMCIAQDGTPYFMVYPKANSPLGNKCPFAISANGLQIPQVDSEPKIIPLEKLAGLLLKLAD